MSTTYTPRAGSVAFRVIEFLLANPDEQLGSADVAIKFDCARNNVHTLLSDAVTAGFLARKEDLEDGELVYVAGNGRALQPTQRVPSVPAHRPFGARPTPRARYWVDTSTLAIEKNVPLPSARNLIDWHGLLSRMEVGDSVALPKEARATLTKAISERHKRADGGKFALRGVGDGCRIWRTD